MSDPVPAGAFPECEAFEQQIAAEVLGGAKKAFTSRKDSLMAIRTTANNHEREIDSLDARVSKVEEVLRDRPF